MTARNCHSWRLGWPDTSWKRTILYCGRTCLFNKLIFFSTITKTTPDAELRSPIPIDRSTTPLLHLRLRGHFGTKMTTGTEWPIGVTFPREDNFSHSQNSFTVYTSSCRVEDLWSFPIHFNIFLLCFPCSAHVYTVMLVMTFNHMTSSLNYIILSTSHHYWNLTGQSPDPFSI